MTTPTSESVPVLSAREVEIERERREKCSHPAVTMYSANEQGVPNMWACHYCRIRFYPACPICVDVGHRNIDHPVEAMPEPPATFPGEVARMRTMLRTGKWPSGMGITDRERMTIEANLARVITASEAHRG